MTDSLRPLNFSHDADQLEAELKQLLLKLYGDNLQALADDINVYGAPHNGSFGLVERNIDADGLTVLRETGEDRIRYLFKAWRHRNGERGLYFLRLYLTALFEGYADVSQLWHEKGAVYPTGARTKLEIETNGFSLDDYFLTSRVRVDLDTEMVPAKLLASLRSAVPARILLNVRIGKFSRNAVGVAGVGYGVNVSRMSWIARPGDGVLTVEGTLPIYRFGTAYAGRLNIRSARGQCSVERIGGDPLPVGTVIRVDQPAKQVVVEWPASSFAATPLELSLKVTDARGKEGFWFGVIDEELVYLTSRPYPVELIEDQMRVSAEVVGFVHKLAPVFDQHEPVLALGAEVTGFVHKGMPTNAHDESAITLAGEVVGFFHKAVVVTAAHDEPVASVSSAVTGFQHKLHPSQSVDEPTFTASSSITGFVHE